MPPHPLAIPQYSSNPYASLPPRTSTVQTFEYNQGRVGTTEVQQQNGQAIDPQSGTRMTSYPTLTLMQSGYSRPFYGNNPMHQGGDEQAERVAGSSVTQFTLHSSTASLSLFSLMKSMFMAYIKLMILCL